MQLWPHQEAAQAFIRENPWCTINHFCGTGKTPIGLETIKRYTIVGTWNLSVVVVPRLSLIHQWHQKLREMEYDGEFLSINSDDDIRDTCASIEFTTDVEEIKRKLLIAKRATTNMCITITYKSVHLLEETLNDASIQTRPDLVLFDEAHHMTEKDVCRKLFDKNESTQAPTYASDSDTSSESESVSSDKSTDELKWNPFWVDIERMVFFTATPMNREGVVMDPELTDNIGQISIDEETLNEWKDEGLVPSLAEPKHVRPAFAGNSHCGPIHRYNHTEAVKDDRCNEFKIAIDLFPKHASSEKTLNATEQTRYELYCSISRAVLSTGNARVLTFHKQVKDSEETMCSVSAMATDDAKVLFCKAFRTVLNGEFEHKRSMYTDIERCINILTIDAKNSPEERTRILNTLDNSPDTDDTKYNNRVTIVASCETIGEGIDTKRCNMVVFVDVIRSFVKIIQRIGRATRRPPTSEPLPSATILLPVGIDVSNYADVQGDPDKRDECIRASMLSENQGDFGLMLNTFAAVRQTDPQLYSICLFYPGRFTPSEVKKNLVRHGFAVVEPDLNASDQARLDEEEDFRDEESVSLCAALAHGETSSVSADEEPLMDTLLEADDSNDAIQRYANRTGRTVEIHSTSMETPVRRIEPTTNTAEGSDANDKVLYYDETKNVYRPTQRVSQADDDDTPVSNTGIREGPPPRKRMVNVHTHPEVKVLWSLTSTNENDSLDLLTRHTQLGYIEATVDMKRAVTQWFDTLDALEAWMAAHEGSRPNQKTDDPTEKRLCNWIGTQLKNAKPPRNGIHAKNDSVHYAWNDHVARHKAFYRSLEEVWFDTLAVLEAWMANHAGTLPSHSAKDLIEKRLARWISTQQQNAKPARKQIHASNDVVHNAWNDHVTRHKVVYRTNDEKWFDTLAALETWMATHKGTRPNKESKDPTEKHLGSWIGNQLKNATSPKKGIHATNDAVHNAWNDHVTMHKAVYRTNEEEWFDTLAELEAWMDAHERTRPCTKSKDSTEKRLGKWISHQQQNAKPPRKCILAMSDSAHNAWNDHVARHKVVYRTNEEEWLDTLGELEAWMGAHPGTRPSHNAKDPTEKRLASWISNQQHKAKPPRKHIHATNDDIHNAWNDHVARHRVVYRTNEEEWFDTFAELEAWMATHIGKRPKQNMKDHTEKRLALWIQVQQRSAKPPRKHIHATHDDINNAWNDHVARHKAVYRTNEEVWFDTLAALEAWMAAHNGTRPNKESKDLTEKRFGQWIGQQQHKAKPPKKDIHATNDAVHNAWNEHVLAHALTKSKKVVYSKKVVDAARAATQALTERIDAILAPYSLRSHDVGAAGDCQFRALADLLLHDAGRHAEVRAAVVAELTTHPERYREFMEEWDNRAVDTHQESYASYLERMAKSGTWGGNTTLLAAATVYGRRIMVVSAPVQEESSYCTEIQPLLMETDHNATTEANDDAPPIWLAYMNGNHYRATRPLDNESGATPSIPPSAKREHMKDRIERIKQASNDTPTSKPKTKKRKAKTKTTDPKPAANRKPPVHKGQTSTDSALSTKKQKVTTVQAPPPPSAPEPIDTTLTAQSLSTGPDTVSPKRAASDMAGSEEATDSTMRARRRRTGSSQAREQRRHAQEEAMRKFQNREPLTDSEHQLIQQMLSNNHTRASTDDSYSDDHHSNVDHVKWKQSMNDTFVELLKRYAPTGGNVIYMDGPSGLTTHTLRRAGVGWTTHVANDCESNAGQLSQLVDRYEMDDVREAMRTTWADVPFVGAYLDTCAGKAETVEDMLQTLVTRTRYGSVHDAPIVLGYTITPRDPSGQNLYERVQRLQKFVNNLCKSQGYRVVKVDEQFDECPNICTNFTHNSVVTHFVVLHRM